MSLEPISQSGDIVDLDHDGELVDDRPQVYTGWTAEQLAATLKPFGVSSRQVWVATEGSKGGNRKGYVLADLPSGTRG